MRLPPGADLARPSLGAVGRAYFFLSTFKSWESVNLALAFIVKVKRLANHFGLHESTASLANPSQSRVKNSEGLGICTYVYSPLSKTFHYLYRSKSCPRLTHQNLSAQLREATGRDLAIFTGQRLKRSNCFLKLSNPLSNSLQVGSSLLKFLYGCEVTRLVRIDVDIRHVRRIAGDV